MVSYRLWIVVPLLSLAAIAHAVAQTAPPDPAAAATPAVPATVRQLDYGVRFGPSFTTLTSVETFDVAAAAAAFEPTLNFGGFMTIGLTGPLSFQPELLFAAKGHRIRDKDAQPVTTPTGEPKLPPANRVILVRYLEFPLLLRLTKRTHENTSVYLIGGPAYAFRRSAVIREVVDSGKREDIGDRVSGTSFSYIAGAGLQHKRWLVDARITRGMQNIASDPTPAPVKASAFSVLMGTRF
jgi:hypothetical protein